MIRIIICNAIADTLEWVGKGAAFTFGALIVLRVMGVSL